MLQQKIKQSARFHVMSFIGLVYCRNVLIITYFNAFSLLIKTKSIIILYDNNSNITL